MNSSLLKKEFLRLISENESIFDLIQQKGSDGLIFYDLKSKNMWSDYNLHNTFGYPAEHDVSELLTKQKELKSLINEICQNLKDDRATFERTVTSTINNGEPILLNCYGMLPNGHNKLLILFSKDSAIPRSGHTIELRKAKHQAAMQELLINIFTTYINLPLDDIKNVINESLKELGEFVAVDRAYVFDYDFDKNVCNNTYEWCAEGIDPQISNSQNLPLEAMPLLVASHRMGEPYYAPEIKSIRDDGLKEILEEQDIQSLLTVPMINNGAAVGFVGFDSVRRLRSYNDQEIGLLKLFAEMLVNIRIRSQKQLEAHKLLLTTTDQNKRLMDFSFMTSHNIRSSVANIIGLTSMVYDEPINKNYLSMLRDTTQKLDDTIRNLSELLNFENELSANSKRDCNLLETINRIIDLNNQVIQSKEIVIKVDIPKSLQVKAIPAFLDSVFHNLITNAIKYGTTEELTTIEIEAKKKKKAIEVRIKDHGLGIDLKKHGDELFKVGTRFHTDKANGQGMGLFMTRHQIERMGGDIEVKSKVGNGTTFKVTFYV